MPTSKDFTYTGALFNLFRKFINYRNLEFFIVFNPKINKTFQRANATAIRVTNESTRRLVEDGMSKGLTNMHTARGFSAL